MSNTDIKIKSEAQDPDYSHSNSSGPSFAAEPAGNPSSGEPRRVLRVVRRLRKTGDEIEDEENKENAGKSMFGTAAPVLGNHSSASPKPARDPPNPAHDASISAVTHGTDTAPLANISGNVAPQKSMAPDGTTSTLFTATVLAPPPPPSTPLVKAPTTSTTTTSLAHAVAVAQTTTSSSPVEAVSEMKGNCSDEILTLLRTLTSQRSHDSHLLQTVASQLQHQGVRLQEVEDRNIRDLQELRSFREDILNEIRSNGSYVAGTFKENSSGILRQMSISDQAIQNMCVQLDAKLDEQTQALRDDTATLKTELMTSRRREENGGEGVAASNSNSNNNPTFLDLQTDIMSTLRSETQAIRSIVHNKANDLKSVTRYVGADIQQAVGVTSSKVEHLSEQTLSDLAFLRNRISQIYHDVIYQGYQPEVQDCHGYDGGDPPNEVLKDIPALIELLENSLDEQKRKNTDNDLVGGISAKLDMLKEAIDIHNVPSGKLTSACSHLTEIKDKLDEVLNVLAGSKFPAKSGCAFCLAVRPTVPPKAVSAPKDVASKTVSTPAKVVSSSAHFAANTTSRYETVNGVSAQDTCDTSLPKLSKSFPFSTNLVSTSEPFDFSACKMTSLVKPVAEDGSTAATFESNNGSTSAVSPIKIMPTSSSSHNDDSTSELKDGLDAAITKYFNSALNINIPTSKSFSKKQSTGVSTTVTPSSKVAKLSPNNDAATSAISAPNDVVSTFSTNSPKAPTSVNNNVSKYVSSAPKFDFTKFTSSSHKVSISTPNDASCTTVNVDKPKMPTSFRFSPDTFDMSLSTCRLLAEVISTPFVGNKDVSTLTTPEVVSTSSNGAAARAKDDVSTLTPDNASTPFQPKDEALCITKDVSTSDSGQDNASVSALKIVPTSAMEDVPAASVPTDTSTPIAVAEDISTSSLNKRDFTSELEDSLKTSFTKYFNSAFKSLTSTSIPKDISTSHLGKDVSTSHLGKDACASTNEFNDASISTLSAPSSSAINSESSNWSPLPVQQTDDGDVYFDCHDKEDVIASAPKDM